MKKKANYRPVDYLVLLYCVINIIYILIGMILHGTDSARLHSPIKHLVIFSAIIFFVILMEKLELSWKNRFVLILRDWYVMVLFLYFFETTSALNRIVFPEFLDQFFMKIDALIFGYQPAREWGLNFNYLWLSELLHFSYFSYYLMGLFYLFVYLKGRDFFLRYAFQLSLVFFLCYLTFNILPVIGGRHLDGMMELTQNYRHGMFTRIMAFIYRNTPHLGGAFPSSHVAIALTVNLSAFHYNRRTGLILLPLVILLTISTVYCHYHYFIDTIFGILYGAGFYYFSGRLYDRKFSGAR